MIKCLSISYLMKAMRAMGISEELIRLVKFFFTNASAAVNLNDFSGEKL